MPYTIQEFARIAKLNEETVSKWCRLGKLKARKFGRVWRIYVDPTKA